MPRTRHSVASVATLLATLLAALPASRAGSQSTPRAPAVPTAADVEADARALGMIAIAVPDADPGIPAYARLAPAAGQLYRDGDWVVIPFYRDPARIPPSFNLLQEFDFPGPAGPGAFTAPLKVRGRLLMEPGAKPGTFPKAAITTGDAVPVWFVRWAVLAPAIRDNVLTIGELRALEPLVGTATHFRELLRPRAGEQLLVIEARGTLADGRRFDAAVVHRHDAPARTSIAIR